MKEVDYINATNLAKIRIAKAVIKDMLFDAKIYDIRQSKLFEEICEFEKEIDSAIKIKD